MTRKTDRYAHQAANKTEVKGQVVRIRASASRAGADAAYLRASIASFKSDWIIDADGRILPAQLAVLKRKGLIT